jgi:hypothetical protein
MVSVATLLCDKEQTHRQAGRDILIYLSTDPDVGAKMPPWSTRFLAKYANDEATNGLAADSDEKPAEPGAPPHQAGGGTAPAPPPPQPVATATSTDSRALQVAVGGILPRIFIHIAAESQRPDANELRQRLIAMQSNGQGLVVPGIQKVTNAPSEIQLRFLKSSDAAEALSLAQSLSTLLGSPVTATDLSKTFGAQTNIKPRTFELWFPPSAAIKLAPQS